MPQYNDYELIYLIQSEHIEQALTIMFKKYELMIYKYLHLYYVKEYDFEDYHQEALILMNDAIMKFDEKKGKTFTRFYELLLKRRITKLNNDRPRYQLTENIEIYMGYNETTIELDLTDLTELEKNVYNKYFIHNQSISFIAEKEEKSVKQIYNAIYRIRDKYKNNML